MADVFLFAGPTLARARAVAPGLRLGDGWQLRPPARRGDVPELVAARPPGTIVLVDGMFHFDLAVGHAELRAALARGWSVWGLASLGAIRAREMAPLGMRGYGRVHALFCQEGRDFRDDEVALLHDEPPSYAELSEPLVHLRTAIAAWTADGALAAAEGDAIVRELEDMWYGSRTLGWMARRLGAAVGDQAARGLLADLDRHRIKAWDLIDFAREHPAP
jgi:hypothetical protein